MNKEKLILSISIGCTALILTMTIFTQFKTIDQTDINAIETMRETELRAELAEWKSKYEEAQKKLDDTNKKINEYKSQMNSEADIKKVLNQELMENELYLGYTDVEGEGIVITLADTSLKSIERYDLISLVNELKLAGAEAISINDERIVNTSDIVLINNNKIILVNGNRISSPYVVKAIGDKKYLESAITIKGGYIDEMTASEKQNSYVIENSIIIPKYTGIMKNEYMSLNKED